VLTGATAVGRDAGELGSSNIDIFSLTGTERDDAANRVVRGNPNRDAVAGNHFDAKAAHTAAQLGEHFMPGVALNSIKPSAVHRHYRSLHVDQIVFAQTSAKSFLRVASGTLSQ